MLSVKRLLYTTAQCSSGCICNRTILRWQIDRIIDRRYGRYVPETFITTDEEAKKYKLDPVVKKVRYKLTYSDYIEKKSLRMGQSKNLKELAKMRTRAKEQKHRDLLEKPVYSVALKYMTDAKMSTDKTTESSIQKDEKVEKKEPKQNDESLVFKRAGRIPLHMPYASTDEYQTIEEIEEIEKTESTIVMPEINEEYKELYEKYLASKETELNEETFLKLLKKDEQKKEPTAYEMEIKRPLEDMSKVPPNWMTDYIQYDDLDDDEQWKSNYGTPDPSVPVSAIPCGGCGALLHCKDSAIPGYLPSELFKNQEKKILNSSICQRCHFMKHYNTTLEVKVGPEDYPALLGHLKKKKVAVIMMIDLTDFPCSIWPGIMNVIGKTTQVFVVGNKVDLLPCDGSNFLKRIENSLVESLNNSGISKANIKSINLISAKTGYGVEQLINKLHKIWENKGDVYMLGCTNVGKSSLFNALLQSDYCKVQAVDLIQRATISPWPGTTLSLLKFPILSPLRWRLSMRFLRLRGQREELASEQEYRKDLYWQTKDIKHLTLQGHIGQSFERKREEGKGFIGKDAGLNRSGYLGLNEKNIEYKNTRWFYDTPGTMHPDQILNFLTTEELMLALPQQIISPRTFTIHKGYTLFVAGLGRLDHSGGFPFIKCTVFASNKLPVTVCKTSLAGEMYKKLIETEAFVVPINDPARLKVFPALESKELTVTGLSRAESAADVVLSSIGWVAITVEEGEEVELTAWTPEGRGIHLRTPAMLARSVNMRGKKIPNSAGHRSGRRVYVKK